MTPERLAELREATEGLGCRNRVHKLTNDELVELLDLAERTGTSAAPPLTADTISDAQIRDLRRSVVGDATATSTATDAMCNLCALALDDGRLPFRIIREARARCAELLNARRADIVILREGSPGSGRFA